MSETRRFVLVHPTARARAAEGVRTAPEGYEVLIRPPRKSRDQEERYHAMFADIAEQWLFCGRKWDAESIKRLCVDQFKRETINDHDFAALWRDMGTVELAPSIDGSGVVALGTQTRKFPKKLASALIEWLLAFGAENGIAWSEPRRSVA